jgi:hypothetical protein
LHLGLDDTITSAKGKLWYCPDCTDSWLRVILVQLGFKIDWGLVGKTGVESHAVVEGFDVVENGCTSLGECGEAVMID